MTDQPKASPETPEESQSEEVVAETTADTPADVPAADTEPAEAESAAAEIPEPAEPQAAESEQPGETAAVDDAETAETETVAEAAETETGETDAVEGDAPELTLGSGAAVEPVERPAPLIRGKIDKFGVAMGTGRRKTSVARVRIKTGTGQFSVNGRSLDEYFCIERDRKMVEAPLQTTETYGKVDVWVRVGGGGTTGQTGAVVLGIARALQAMDPALHYTLADNGYLTRDGRMVERKKYGYKKARKSFQFSKR